MPKLEVDHKGDINGLKVVQGYGYEIPTTRQHHPEDHMKTNPNPKPNPNWRQHHPEDHMKTYVQASRGVCGDGTINYQSLRWHVTWKSY